jgi:hypothetical protein
MFEPLYDSYAGMCAAVGAKLVAVQLAAPDWSIPWDQLEAAFTPATKLVLVNTPHNPTGGWVWTWSSKCVECVGGRGRGGGCALGCNLMLEPDSCPGGARWQGPTSKQAVASRVCCSCAAAAQCALRTDMGHVVGSGHIGSTPLFCCRWAMVGGMPACPWLHQRPLTLPRSPFPNHPLPPLPQARCSPGTSWSG